MARVFLIGVALCIIHVVEVSAVGECASSSCSTSNAVCVDTGYYGDPTCQCSGQYVGINCDEEYSAQVCESGHIYERNAVIESDGYPNLPNQLTCFFQVRIHGATVINITVEDFRLEKDKDTFTLGFDYTPSFTGDNVQDFHNGSLLTSRSLYTDHFFVIMFTDRNVPSEGYRLVLSADGDDCLSELVPCMNGGTCIDLWQNYTCTCPSGYTGDRCETDIDFCRSDPCLNGGTCNSDTEGYTCMCTASFTGIICETGIVLVSSSSVSVDTATFSTFEGISVQSLDFSFTFSPTALASYSVGGAGTSDLWGVEVFFNSNSDGSGVAHGNQALTTLTAAQRQTVWNPPGSTTIAGIQAPAVNVGSGVICSDIQYFCARLTQGISPSPVYELRGVPTDDSLLGCTNVPCRGVEITGSELSITSGALREGVAGQTVVFNFALTAGDAGSVSGTNLWQFTAFGSQSADGSSMSTASYNVPLTAGEGSIGISAGASANFANLDFGIDLSGDVNCADVPFICVTASRSASANPAFSLSGTTTNALTACEPVSCRGVELDSTAVNVVGFVRQGESDSVDVSVSLSANAAGGSAVGSDLWSLTGFASNDANGNGARYGESAIALTQSQADTNLDYGTTATINSLTYTLDLQNGPVCSQFRYICVEIEKGSNAVPDFDLNPAQSVSCDEIQCRGVNIATLNTLLLTNEVFHGQEQDVSFNLQAAVDPNYGSVSGTDLWMVTAWVSDLSDGSNPIQSSSVSLSAAQADQSADSGATIAFNNLMFPLNLITTPTCTDFSFFCVQFQRDSGSSVDFELGGDLLSCVPLTCTDINECGSAPCLNGGICTDEVNGYTCDCAAGYTGVRCQTDIDECASTPCLNGGICNDEVNGYTCNCLGGYTGVRCQTDINECASTPCQNGGTCNNEINFFTCDCPGGYTGVQCQTDIDECESNPCQNGGLCLDQINRFQCICMPGYTGVTCGTDINECSSFPCRNGATCDDAINAYSCTCLPGYEGPLCENDINECDSSPCIFGSCDDQVDGYICTCIPGYTGVNCDINIDECASGPCRNGGACNDGINSYTCTCSPGFTGTYCETDINECASNPCFQGHCIDRVNSYECVCFAGYTGVNCDINIDECLSSPCQNGDCEDLINGYVCNCNPGYTGIYCETDINECADVVCQNGGVCVELVINSFVCTCEPGFTGTYCEINVDECYSGPCQNGAVCIDGINMYTCRCPPGFTGAQCQTDVDDCDPDPCYNGGTCTDGVNTFTCQCTSEWTGARCELSLNACRSYPCQNGANCVNVGTSYVCECLPGFAGYNCEVDINECSSLPCQNGGRCIDGIAMYTCQCPQGFTGTNCQEVGFCDLEGDWYNECNDRITLSQTSTGMLLGLHYTNAEILTGYSAPVVLVGYANRNNYFPSFGYVVSRDNGDSTTSWSGQCHLCDGEEVLYTMWTNTWRVNTCAEVKKATLVGQDKWTRYPQSPAPREDEDP